MSGLCPFAVQKIIAPGPNDPAIKPRVAILHVDAGNASSLFDYFAHRSGGIESHFFVKADGGVEQYRDIYRQADANLDANDFAVSIETQGFGAGEWSLQQLASIKRLLSWLNTEAGIPLRKIQKWNGSGVGYHTLFGAPSHWTPVAKTCPGPNRIKQFDGILVPWMRTQGKPAPRTPRKRAVWLENRSKRGMTTPLPLGSIVVNGMSGGGVSEKRSLAILKRAAETPGVDEIYGCEFGNITTDFPLDPTIWDWVHDPSSPSRAGSLYAIRKTRGKVESFDYKLGCPAGFGIRARWIIRARVIYDPHTPNAWKCTNLALHGPPKRAWHLTPVFMAATLAAGGDKAGGDWNRLAAFVAKALSNNTRFVGILGHAFARWIPASAAKGIDVGGDHLAVFCRYWPENKEH